MSEDGRRRVTMIYSRHEIPLDDPAAVACWASLTEDERQKATLDLALYGNCLIRAGRYVPWRASNPPPTPRLEWRDPGIGAEHAGLPFWRWWLHASGMGAVSRRLGEKKS